MMRLFDYCLFDLDGTLLDTRDGVIAASVKAMHDFDKNIPSESVLESLIGPPMQVSYKKIFGLTDDEAMKMANVFREYYKTDEFLFRATPYNGIFRTIEELISCGVMIGIATYKREDYAKRLLCDKGFDKYTNHMYGSDFDGKLKKSDIIRLCLDRMECRDYTRAVYIGDGISDGKGANDARISFIAVTYGFGFKTAEEAMPYNPYCVVKNNRDVFKHICIE